MPAITPTAIPAFAPGFKGCMTFLNAEGDGKGEGVLEPALMLTGRGQERNASAVPTLRNPSREMESLAGGNNTVRIG